MDLSIYFLLASIKLLSQGGHLSFLLPGKMLQAKYAHSVREYLCRNFQLNYLFDFGLDQNFVFRADTFPLVLGMTRAALEPSPITVERHGKGFFFQMREVVPLTSFLIRLIQGLCMQVPGL